MQTKVLKRRLGTTLSLLRSPPIHQFNYVAMQTDKLSQPICVFIVVLVKHTRMKNCIDNCAHYKATRFSRTRAKKK